jgi:hypothetical protein
VIDIPDKAPKVGKADVPDALCRQSQATQKERVPPEPTPIRFKSASDLMNSLIDEDRDGFKQ